MRRQFLFQSCIAVLLLAGPWLSKLALAGSAWDVNTVDNTGMVGLYTSIALDANGYPHISYWDGANDDLKYAHSKYFCEYVLSGDMNDDCKFDFRDFALMAKNWLIDCDKNPPDPACVPKGP